MSINSFGRVFRVTTWGESHGMAIGTVIDGVPANIPLHTDDIQPFLDKRKPGTSAYVTQRREPDTVEILSGVFEGMTTGMPISLVIRNADTRSKDYQDIQDKFRPGHADYTYWKKYGIRDYRGGGRSSARETACRVAAGAIARKVLGETIEIRSALIQIGTHAIDRTRFDWRECQQNPFWCPDAMMVEVWQDALNLARKERNSLGAIVEVVAKGVPAGLGAPVYGKIDADLACAFMGINAVKGVEIGAGMEAALLDGKTMSGGMQLADTTKTPTFSDNHAGGILGGITNGDDIVVRFAIKATSSIPQPIATLNQNMEATTIETKGRHDPCVGIRAAPVGEAMMALVLADHLLLAKAHEPAP